MSAHLWGWDGVGHVRAQLPVCSKGLCVHLLAFASSFPAVLDILPNFCTAGPSNIHQTRKYSIKTLKFLSFEDMLQTSLSLLMSLRNLRLSLSRLRSLSDIFTSRRFILCLQGLISHPPTEKGPGSREGSGGGKQPPGASVEPRSGKEMELKRQRGGAESGWRLVGFIWSSVSHQLLPAAPEDAGAAG